MIGGPLRNALTEYEIIWKAFEYQTTKDHVNFRFIQLNSWTPI